MHLKTKKGGVFISFNNILITGIGLKEQRTIRNNLSSAISGSPTENRTPDSALRGLRLNRLTMRPFFNYARKNPVNFRLLDYFIIIAF